MQNQQPASSFDEIRAILRHQPGPDLDAGTAAALRQDQLTKPRGALGRLEEVAQWLATWQGRHPPELRRPRICVFAANHGVAARGVSAYPASVTAQMVRNFIDGGAAVNQLSEMADADLRVYEMDLDRPTAYFTTGPAMSEEACARAAGKGIGNDDGHRGTGHDRKQQAGGNVGQQDGGIDHGECESGLS